MAGRSSVPSRCREVSLAAKTGIGYARTMLKPTIAGVLLLGTWLILAGNLAPETVVTGALASGIAILVFRDLIVGKRWLGRPERLRPGQAPRRPVLIRLRRLSWVLVFVPVYLWKVLLSGVGMAIFALKPSIDFWPGIVRVEAKLNTVSGTTLFANLLTLTPGTLTIDYDEDDDALYVHWIDVTGYGEADFDRRVTSGLRVWMKRIEA
ncbi:MAG: Na+/H+ antiporter subunit E [Spirochaetota bacterium]